MNSPTPTLPSPAIAGWMFEPAPTARSINGKHGSFVRKGHEVIVSSGVKKIYRGSYVSYTGLVHDAVAMVFDPSQVKRFGMESATLARNELIHVGPRVLELTVANGFDGALPNQPVIIEEDAGVSLESALFSQAVVPGEGASVLHAIGTPEREVENAKILFDVLCQAFALHEKGMFHRDLRPANVCLKRWGSRPQDIRATLIDFELSTSADDLALEACARNYYDLLFSTLPQTKQPGLVVRPTPLMMDLGYLALLRYEVETGLPAETASEQDLYCDAWPSFRYDEEGRPLVHRLSFMDDIEPFARKAELSFADEKTVPDDYERRLLLEASGRGGWLDAYDLREHELEHRLLGFAGALALRIFERYKLALQAQGKSPAYERFEDQPADLQESNIAQARSFREKIESLGYRVVPVELCGAEERVTAFAPEELEYLARVEHNRWWKEREAKGWTLGPKDVDAKRSPYLLPYEDLSEDIKELDREPVRGLMELLDEIGFAVTR